MTFSVIFIVHLTSLRRTRDTPPPFFPTQTAAPHPLPPAGPSAPGALHPPAGQGSAQRAPAHPLPAPETPSCPPRPARGCRRPRSPRPGCRRPGPRGWWSGRCRPAQGGGRDRRPGSSGRSAWVFCIGCSSSHLPGDLRFMR